MPVVDQVERDRELRDAQRAAGEIAQHDRGAGGPIDVLNALRNGQVDTLIMNEDFQETGWADYTMDMYGLGPVPAEHPPLWRHYSRNYLCTSNASLRRDHLLEAGLFDASFARWEDAELGVRLKRLGVRWHFRSRAVVYHLKPPEDLATLMRIAGADGRSAAALYRRYPGLAMWLRSGLHPLNLVRSRMLTAGPLLELLRRSARGAGPLPEGLARSILLEREYLNAGVEELRRAGQNAGAPTTR